MCVISFRLLFFLYGFLFLPPQKIELEKEVGSRPAFFTAPSSVLKVGENKFSRPKKRNKKITFFSLLSFSTQILSLLICLLSFHFQIKRKFNCFEAVGGNTIFFSSFLFLFVCLFVSFDLFSSPFLIRENVFRWCPLALRGPYLYPSIVLLFVTFGCQPKMTFSLSRLFLISLLFLASQSCFNNTTSS